MDFKHLVRQVCPPIILSTVKSLHYRLFHPSHNHLTDDYTTWDETAQASTGYDSDHILEKTKQALLKVKNGEATYERDSVLFDEIHYSWPLLAGLMWAAARSGGKLNVLDFGGSLGSTYFQNRLFLRELFEVRWNVVEQHEHVRIGREFFEDDILRFYPDIEAYSAKNVPDVIVLSSVLQYMEKPYELLGELFKLHPTCLILDRTPFWEGKEDRIFVQQVPHTIYEASYPICLLSKKIFIDYIQGIDFNLIAKFEAQDKLEGPLNFSHCGMILSKAL
jgi:putative methyltransferase (TIGR04325 family)